MRPTGASPDSVFHSGVHQFRLRQRVTAVLLISSGGEHFDSSLRRHRIPEFRIYLGVLSHLPKSVDLRTFARYKSLPLLGLPS